MKMKTVDRSDLLDGWLKYHNTTVNEVIKIHSKETLGSPEWFKLYPCTEEQCNEWETWAKKYIKEKTKLSKKEIERSWPWIFLDCSPYVKDE